MAIPGFLLRKLYKRGSLREIADGTYAFVLQNPLANATLIGPPNFVINGVHFPPETVDAGKVDLAAISEDAPLVFEKGDHMELRFPGRLLRGGNRIHFTILTREFDELDVLVEDKEADFCDMPGPSSKEEE